MRNEKLNGTLITEIKTDFIMKKIFVLLLLFIFFSCKSDFDKDNLKFEIHKFHINKSNEFSCLGYELEDYNKISIDSIKEYPKHLYLQEKIEFQNRVMESYIKNKEHNSNLHYEVLALQEQELDSLKNIFSKTDKDQLYYKCYFSYSDLGFSNLIMLDGKYKPIECELPEIESEQIK